jgi:hypothetical protein
MSGDEKRSVAAWPKLPRSSSTLPRRPKPIQQACPELAKADTPCLSALHGAVVAQILPRK